MTAAAKLRHFPCSHQIYIRLFHFSCFHQIYIKIKVFQAPVSMRYIYIGVFQFCIKINVFEVPASIRYSRCSSYSISIRFSSLPASVRTNIYMGVQFFLFPSDTYFEVFPVFSFPSDLSLLSPVQEPGRHLSS